MCFLFGNRKKKEEVKTDDEEIQKDIQNIVDKVIEELDNEGVDTMGATDEQLSKNFKRSEFVCKCGCGKFNADPKLVKSLQKLRDTIGTSIIINSACRCEAHNKAVGGVPNSQHVQGKAADIRVSGLTPRELAKFAEEIPDFNKGGIGTYNSFVHVDVRGTKARWKG